jgi:hypothetical protein
MTKKVDLKGITRDTSFEYPRLDIRPACDDIPEIWFGSCMLGYKGNNLRLMSGVKVEETIGLRSTGVPTSYAPSDPDLPKAVFSVITGINPRYLDPKRFKEIRSGKCKCKYPIRMYTEDSIRHDWKKLVCARCLKLVKRNE